MWRFCVLLLPLAGCISNGSELPAAVPAFIGTATYEVWIDGQSEGRLSWTVGIEPFPDSDGVLRDVRIENIERDFDSTRGFFPDLLDATAVRPCGLPIAQRASDQGHWTYGARTFLAWSLAMGFADAGSLQGYDGYQVAEIRPVPGGIRVYAQEMIEGNLLTRWELHYSTKDALAPITIIGNADGHVFKARLSGFNGSPVGLSCSALVPAFNRPPSVYWGTDGPGAYPETSPPVESVIGSIRNDTQLERYRDYAQEFGLPVVVAVAYDNGRTTGDSRSSWRITFYASQAPGYVFVDCTVELPLLAELLSPDCRDGQVEGELPWVSPNGVVVVSPKEWLGVIRRIGEWTPDNWYISWGRNEVLMDFVKGPRAVGQIQARMTVNASGGTLLAWLEEDSSS